MEGQSGGKHQCVFCIVDVLWNFLCSRKLLAYVEKLLSTGRILLFLLCVVMWCPIEHFTKTSILTWQLIRMFVILHQEELQANLDLIQTYRLHIAQDINQENLQLFLSSYNRYRPSFS